MGLREHFKTAKLATSRGGLKMKVASLLAGIFLLTAQGVYGDIVEEDLIPCDDKESYSYFRWHMNYLLELGALDDWTDRQKEFCYLQTNMLIKVMARIQCDGQCTDPPYCTDHIRESPGMLELYQATELLREVVKDECPHPFEGRVPFIYFGRENYP